MITFLTVNYRCARSTIALLRSLERQTDRAFDVIVIDNDSPEDDRILLTTYAATSPLAIEIIASDENRGFSGGNNLGIRKALAQGSRWVALVNPDTTAPEDLVQSLRAHTTDEPAVIGIPLREGDRTAYCGMVRWLSATLTHVYTRMPLRPLAYAIGAGMVVHRDVFDRAGLLDERYFLYFEDAEFTLRARRAGFSLRYTERPALAHAVQAVTGSLGAPRLLRYHYRNALLFNKTHAPWMVQVALPFWAAAVFAKQCVTSVFAHVRRPYARAIMAGIIDHYRGHYGRIA